MEAYFEVNLRCPHCQARLKRDKFAGETILGCAYCQLAYPLFRGQVCLLPERTLAWTGEGSRRKHATSLPKDAAPR